MRSAIAVACCSRFSSVGALRMPPPSCTERAAAAEIWNGMSRSTARGSTGWPAASSSAGANPLRTPDSGSGQRLISSAYSAAPMPRMSSSGVASGMVAGNANATSPSMLTRTRLGWSIDSATPDAVGGLGGGGQRLDRAGAADRGRRRLGHFLQGPAADPLADHQPAGAGVRDVEDAGDAGHVDAAQLQRAVQDLLQLLVGQRRVGVDEGQRDLPVQRGVQRLPELQVGRAAVEDQQPVAAAADGGAGDEVDVLVGGGRLDRRFARRVEGQRSRVGSPP